MKKFTDVPDFYTARVRRMYRATAKQIVGCPNFMSINHLLGPCKQCATPTTRMHKTEPTITVTLPDRKYHCPDDKYTHFCLKSFVKRGYALYTCVEFPTPKIASQNITRIPHFYEPSTNLIIDCFATAEEVDNKSNQYFISKAQKVCSQYGLHYCQMLVNRTEFQVIYRQPIAGFDELLHKLLQQYNSGFEAPF